MIVVIMGVVGAGKTTIGQLLAEQQAWEFADADSFHSAANVEKMRLGHPLDDADRLPWIASLHSAILSWISQQRNVVLACSALKRTYREQLSEPEVCFVYLRGDPQLIAHRLHARSGHYATEMLLASQLAILEEPEDAITVDIRGTPQEIVAEIRQKIPLT